MYGIQGTEDQQAALIASLLVVQSDAKNLLVPKDGHNPAFRSKFASYQGIVERVTPMLYANGFAVSFSVTPEGLVLQLLHASGGMITSCLPLEHGRKIDALIEGFRAAAATGSAEAIGPLFKALNGVNPSQMQGAAITYGRRYLMAAILNLVADEDDDGNSAGGGDWGLGSHSSPPQRSSQPPSGGGTSFGGGGGYPSTPCPNCGQDDSVIKDKFAGDPNAKFCWPGKNDGCGHKWVA